MLEEGRYSIVLNFCIFWEYFGMVLMFFKGLAVRIFVKFVVDVRDVGMLGVLLFFFLLGEVCLFYFMVIFILGNY